MGMNPSAAIVAERQQQQLVQVPSSSQIPANSDNADTQQQTQMLPNGANEAQQTLTNANNEAVQQQSVPPAQVSNLQLTETLRDDDRGANKHVADQASGPPPKDAKDAGDEEDKEVQEDEEKKIKEAANEEEGTSAQPDTPAEKEDGQKEEGQKEDGNKEEVDAEEAQDNQNEAEVAEKEEKEAKKEAEIDGEEVQRRNKDQAEKAKAIHKGVPQVSVESIQREIDEEKKDVKKAEKAQMPMGATFPWWKMIKESGQRKRTRVKFSNDMAFPISLTWVNSNGEHMKSFYSASGSWTLDLAPQQTVTVMARVGQLWVAKDKDGNEVERFLVPTDPHELRETTFFEVGMRTTLHRPRGWALDGVVPAVLHNQLEQVDSDFAGVPPKEEDEVRPKDKKEDSAKGEDDGKEESGEVPGNHENEDAEAEGMDKGREEAL